MDQTIIWAAVIMTSARPLPHVSFSQWNGEIYTFYMYAYALLNTYITTDLYH